VRRVPHLPVRWAGKGCRVRRPRDGSIALHGRALLGSVSVLSVMCPHFRGSSGISAKPCTATAAASRRWCYCAVGRTPPMSSSLPTLHAQFYFSRSAAPSTSSRTPLTKVYLRASCLSVLNGRGARVDSAAVVQCDGALCVGGLPADLGGGWRLLRLDPVCSGAGPPVGGAPGGRRGRRKFSSL